MWIKMPLEIDSCYHLSSSKNGVCWGAGITKGSEGITVDGEKIKAGKFPVLFCGYESTKVQKDRNNVEVKRRNKRLLSKYSNGMDLMNTVSGMRSVHTLGTLPSE